MSDSIRFLSSDSDSDIIFLNEPPTLPIKPERAQYPAQSLADVIDEKINEKKDELYSKLYRKLYRDIMNDLTGK